MIRFLITLSVLGFPPQYQRPLKLGMRKSENIAIPSINRTVNSQDITEVYREPPKLCTDGGDDMSFVVEPDLRGLIDKVVVVVEVLVHLKLNLNLRPSMAYHSLVNGHGHSVTYFGQLTKIKFNSIGQ